MRRAPVVLFLVLFLIPGLLIPPGSSFRIIEFCPDTYLPRDADAYLVLEGTGPLANVSLSDGEGNLSFPPGTLASGRVT
ncbi:MAG: phospholipase, partial [Methanomicrobiales archaeon]|nr:phospholipase [Methanomicrobiales archaeon]